MYRHNLVAIFGYRIRTVSARTPAALRAREWSSIQFKISSSVNYEPAVSLSAC